MSEITTKIGTHKGLKRLAFAIQVCFRQISSLQITDNRSNSLWGQADIILENFFVSVPAFFIQIEDTLCQFRCYLLLYGINIFLRSILRFLNIKDLESVRLSVLAWLAFIPYFAKDEFVQFIKSVRRIQLSTCPKRLMGFFEAVGKFTFRHLFQVKELLFDDIISGFFIPQASTFYVGIFRNRFSEKRNVRDLYSCLSFFINLQVRILNAGSSPDIFDSSGKRISITGCLLYGLYELGF